MISDEDLEKIYANPYPRITLKSGEYYLEQNSAKRFRIYPPGESLLNAVLADTLSPEERRDLRIGSMRTHNKYDAKALHCLEELLRLAPLPTN